MESKYYYVKTQVDSEGIAHLPCNIVEFLVEVPFSKCHPGAGAHCSDPDEMALAIGIAEDVVRAKYPVENASYNTRKPTLEINPAAVISREDFVTAANGSKGWLMSQATSPE